MNTIFTKAMLGTALAATVTAGALAGAVPASAREWGGAEHHDGGGAGVAVAAGVLGLIAGAAIASDHGPHGPPPVVYQTPQMVYQTRPIAYPAPDPCYNAYPGYDGYCYPASYYVNSGWGWHEGAWWYGGARYARPFVIGGYRGGDRGDYRFEVYRGGYRFDGYRGGDHRDYRFDGYRGGDHDAYRGGGGFHDGDGRGRR